MKVNRKGRDNWNPAMAYGCWLMDMVPSSIAISP